MAKPRTMRRGVKYLTAVVPQVELEIEEKELKGVEVKMVEWWQVEQ